MEATDEDTGEKYVKGGGGQQVLMLRRLERDVMATPWPSHEARTKGSFFSSPSAVQRQRRAQQAQYARRGVLRELGFRRLHETACDLPYFAIPN